MYFRLLSMRILVDWKNYQPWSTIFFYYFLATWAIMNAWAIYGVAKYYNKDGNSGVDPVSFSTFVVVNLQTIQLLLYYFKLLSSESRLVSLNQIFERAPIEAQKLLEYTYVIEEEDLIEECYMFALHTRRVFARRILNIVTCCIFAKDWHDAGKQARFDIERLKRCAPNFDQVERNVEELRSDLKDGSQEKEGTGSTQPGPEVEVAEGPACSPDQVVTHVNEGDAGAGRQADGKPREMLAWIGCLPLRWMYSHCYASLHSLHVSVMVSFPSWPFRPDSPYFRMLTLVQLLGVLGVGAIVVLGWVYSTSESNCNKATKTCRNCLAVHERYFLTQEPLCTSFETAIASIVASSNGTWLNHGVLQERYCNWVCYGNFTVASQCPPIN
ncbi:hypothetical protein Vafri_14873 [Volvox africanus]|uniref:Uncharacterized protein n=1 Tax=Volvox africanus TaxID=51714 RepID=A0A8J4BFF9_9CHLO|nr:hypothetical protein Vafri_14873 [Volvox africanus]